jgi:uncharacterized membrane protein
MGQKRFIIVTSPSSSELAHVAWLRKDAAGIAPAAWSETIHHQNTSFDFSVATHEGAVIAVRVTADDATIAQRQTSTRRRNVSWPAGFRLDSWPAGFRLDARGKGAFGMSDSFALGLLIYLHVLSLTLWFGSLFGYLFIVWPAIMSDAEGAFPREILVGIAIRSAPWIYVGMSTALLSLAGVWLVEGMAARGAWMVGYTVLLIALVANNVYGTMVAWPRIMFLPESMVRREWFWFQVRMSVSLVVGLALFSSAIIVT